MSRQAFRGDWHEADTEVCAIDSPTSLKLVGNPEHV